MNKAYGKAVLAPTGKFGGMLRYEFAFGPIGPKAKGGSGIRVKPRILPRSIAKSVVGFWRRTEDLV